MNQPTEDRFKRLEEKVRKLEEQITEPIKITRLEIDSGNIHKRLDTIEENTNITKVQMEGARADLLKITESQADLRDRLIEHSEDLQVIKEKQDAHSELLGQLITIGEETKSDIAEIKTTQREHSTRFDRLEGIMLQILNRLPKAEEE